MITTRARATKAAQLVHLHRAAYAARLARVASVALRCAVVVFCAAASGCFGHRGLVERNLMDGRGAAGRATAVTEHYQIGCPDVLEIAVKGRPEFEGHYTVEPDGRINLGHYGRLRIQGQVVAEVGRALAEEIGVRAEDVRVRVVEFRSQHLVVFGGVTGMQRTVAYRGPETVHELLQRVGGITPGAAAERVYVVRAHLGDGERPELFHVDLDAIVMDGDQRTNVRLLPYDQVYVGETRQARIEYCIPAWLRPLYQKVWRLLPTGREAP
jgi:protein involved in polysaccharide export with SLBB domain